MTSTANAAAAAVTIQVPTSLRRFTGHCAAIEVSAVTAGQALREAGDRWPQLRSQLFAADGSLRRFINIFVNSKDIRHMQQEQTALRDRDVITLLPAIAGG